jgi:hypothetical protein
MHYLFNSFTVFNYVSLHVHFVNVDSSIDPFPLFYLSYFFILYDCPKQEEKRQTVTSLTLLKKEEAPLFNHISALIIKYLFTT